MSNKEKLIERARKLFAMSQDQDSENEAQIAMRRVTAMMKEHGITMEDIQKKKTRFTEGEGKTWSQMPEWYKILATANGLITDTRPVLSRPDNKTTLFFQGMDGDSQVAVMMQDYLEECMERAAKRFKKSETYQIKMAFMESPQSTMYDFRYGFAIQMWKRAAKIAEDRKVEVDEGTGTSLVVVKQDLIEQHFSDVTRTQRPKKPKRKMDSETYFAGADAANSVSLNGQLGSGEKQGKLQ